jgi:hypothetical protein
MKIAALTDKARASTGSMRVLDASRPTIQPLARKGIVTPSQIVGECSGVVAAPRPRGASRK